MNCTREELVDDKIVTTRPTDDDWTRLIIYTRVFDEARVVVNHEDEVQMPAILNRKGIRVEHKFDRLLLIESVALVVERNVWLVWRYDKIRQIGRKEPFKCTFEPPNAWPTLFESPAATWSRQPVGRTLAIDVFNTNDGDLTRAYFALLEGYGLVGRVAVHLLRAAKAASRGPHYSDTKHRENAEQRKQWALESLVAILKEHADTLKIPWGWRNSPLPVLAIELPTGYVQFEMPTRLRGPEYEKTPLADYWQAGVIDMRIIKFCDRLTTVPA